MHLILVLLVVHRHCEPLQHFLTLKRSPPLSQTSPAATQLSVSFSSPSSLAEGISETVRFEADAAVVMDMRVVVVAEVGASVVDVALPACWVPRNVPAAREMPRRNRRKRIIAARLASEQSARRCSV
jgi:hypothetical protein